LRVAAIPIYSIAIITDLAQSGLNDSITAKFKHACGTAAISISGVAIIALFIRADNSIAADRRRYIAFLVFGSIHRAAYKASTALVGAAAWHTLSFALIFPLFFAYALARADIA
jgi:hypothetical protein